MTSFIDPYFTPPGLAQYQGYHLQIFSSGRAKLSLQGEGRQQVHYYCERPKKDKEGYQRQKKRSYAVLPEHFDLVEQILASYSKTALYRVHVQGDNNATADNMHLVATQEEACLWLIFGSVVHKWDLPGQVHRALLAGRGPKRGAASLFHEYMPSYEHDWGDICFEEADYRLGYRASDVSAPPPVSSVPPRPPEPVRQEPQPAGDRYPSKPQPYEIMPDGSLAEPYEDHEPDPLDWAAAEEEEEDFEWLGSSQGAEPYHVSPPVTQTDRGSSGSSKRPYTPNELWAEITAQNGSE